MNKNNLDSTSIGTSVPQTTPNVGNGCVSPNVVEKIVECNNHAFRDSTQRMYNMYNIENEKLLRAINSYGISKQDLYSGDKVIDTSSQQQADGETGTHTKGDIPKNDDSSFDGVIISDPELNKPTGHIIDEKAIHEITFSCNPCNPVVSEIYDCWKEFMSKPPADDLQPVVEWSSPMFSEKYLNNIFEELKCALKEICLPEMTGRTTPTTATEVCEENRRLARLGFPIPEKTGPMATVQSFGSFDVNSRVVVNPELSIYDGYPHYQDDVGIQAEDDTSVSLLKVPDGKSSTGGRVIAVLAASGRGDIHLHHEKDGNIVVIDSLPELPELNPFDGDIMEMVPIERVRSINTPKEERSGKAKKFSFRNGKMVPTSQLPSFMTRPKNNKKRKKR